MADSGAETGRELVELLAGLDYRISGERPGLRVTAMTSDSRQVTPGSLFVAIAGLTVDGHRFVDEAIARGCAAVLVNRDSGCKAGGGQTVWIEAPDTRIALGHMAAAFYGHPAREMKMIGITGTNGKTTTTYLLEAVIGEAGGRPGIIGTVNYRYGDVVQSAPFTTPEPVALQSLLRRMADSGVTHVVMEVSSHALEMKRLEGVLYDVALFTNLSRDHLDYHGDMAGYFASKKKLFSRYLKRGGSAVVLESLGPVDALEPDGNDTDWGKVLVDELAAWNRREQEAGQQLRLLTCGLAAGDVRVERFRYDLQGVEAEMVTPAGSFRLRSPLVGEFNLLNIVGAAGVGIALGYGTDVINSGLARVQGIPGRLERIEAEKNMPRQADGPENKDVKVFVDYAHTPDALENVLHTLRKLNPSRLVVVFGCGGDRDQGKRKLMGQAAGRLADVVVATSDNPRSESPTEILDEIETGLQETPLHRMPAAEMLDRGQQGYDVIVSRRQAIATAIRFAKPGDVVLISGKGHEDYQITSKGKSFFDDRIEARNQLAAAGR